MSEYTPTTDEVRAEYVQNRAIRVPTTTAVASEFDRWLAAHDREVKAEAFDEGWVDRANREPWVYGKRTNDAPPPPSSLNPYRGA